MATIAELLVKIGADSSGLQKELAASERQLKRAFGKEGLNLSSSAVDVMEGIAVAAGLAGAAAIKCAADFETMTTAYSTLLGSADAGKAMTKQLQDLAIVTPYTTQELGAAARQMLAYGFAAKDIPGLLVNIGNASSSLGLGTEGIQRITLALGQMGAKGTVQAEEMRQLAEAGIPAWKALADAMGVSIPQAMDAVEKRTVSSATGISAVLDAMNAKFGGGMEAQSKTIAGAFSNIMDSTQLLAGAVGEAINQFTGLSGALTSAANYMAAFARITQDNGIYAAMQQLVPSWVVLGVLALGAAIMGVAVPALYSMATAAYVALAPFAPFIAGALALAAVAFEIYQNWSVVAPLFTSIFGVLTTLIKGVYDAAVTYFSAVYDAAASNWSLISGVVSDVLSGIYSAVVSVFEGIIGLGSWLVDGISNALPVLEDTFRSVFGDGVYNAVAATFKGLYSVIDQFISYVTSKLSGVLSFASRLYNSVAGVIGAAKTTDWGSIKLGFSVPDIAGTIAKTLPKTSPAAVTKPDMSGFGANAGGAAKASKSAAKEAAQVVKAQADYEIDVEKNKARLIVALAKDEEADLDRQRKGGLNAMREYWAGREKVDEDGITNIQEYWNKRTALETKGMQAELDALSKEKEAIEKQQAQTSDPSDGIELKKKWLDITTQITLKERELGEVVKKNAASAAEEMANYTKEYASFLIRTKESMKELDSKNQIAGLNGSAKDIAEFDKAKTDAIKDAEDVANAYNQAVAEFEDKYGKSVGNVINMEAWKAKKIEQINKNSADQISKYYATGKAAQADLDEAYSTGDITSYMQTLNSQEGILQNHLKSRQSMIDEYADLWQKANHNVYDDAVTLMSSVYDGLENVLDKFMHGTASASDVFKAFANSVIDGIIKIQAQAAAASITQGLMGLFGSSPKSNAFTLSNGTTLDSNFGIGNVTSGVHLASGGSVFGLGTATSDSIPAMLSNGEYVIQAASVNRFGLGFFDAINAGRLPAFSTGGLVAGGPSLSEYSANANYSQGTTENYAKGGNVTLELNITNNTGGDVSAQNVNMTVEGQKIILDMVLDGAARNVNGFGNNMKTILTA